MKKQHILLTVVMYSTISHLFAHFKKTDLYTINQPMVRICMLDKNNSQQCAQVHACMQKDIIKSLNPYRYLRVTSDLGSDYRNFVVAYDQDEQMIAVMSYFYVTHKPEKIYINYLGVDANYANVEFVRSMIDFVQQNSPFTIIWLWVDASNDLHAILSASGFVQKLYWYSLQKAVTDTIVCNQNPNITISIMDVTNENQLQSFADFLSSHDFAQIFGKTSNSVKNYLLTHDMISFWAHDAQGNVCAAVFLEKEGASVKLYSLGVHPEYRRQGIATALLAHIQHWAKQEGIEKMILNLEPNNKPALHLYTKLGFEFFDQQIQMELHL